MQFQTSWMPFMVKSAKSFDFIACVVVLAEKTDDVTGEEHVERADAVVVVVIILKTSSFHVEHGGVNLVKNRNANLEVEEAKKRLGEMKKEETSVRDVVESLKQELENVKRDIVVFKGDDLKGEKLRTELDHNKQPARRKEEETKRRVETLWREAQHSELAMREAEAKLEIAQREVQEVKEAKEKMIVTFNMCYLISEETHVPATEARLKNLILNREKLPKTEFGRMIFYPVVNGSKDKPAKSANKASFKLKRKGRLQSTPSSTFINSNKLGNSIKPVKTVIQNKNSVKKKSKQDLPSAIYVIENVTFFPDTCLVCERCCGSRDSMKLLLSYMLEARAQQMCAGFQGTMKGYLKEALGIESNMIGVVATTDAVILAYPSVS
ncbi:hypothetical protein Tco_1117677 [Tanacetum coccineum]